MKRKPKEIVFAENIHFIWFDNQETRVSYFQLRSDCPCASCVDEITGEKTLDNSRLDKNIYPQKSEYVGNYALRIYWSDGHNTGIYTFRSIRENYESIGLV